MAKRKRKNGSKVEKSRTRKKPLAFFKPFILETCSSRLMLPLAWTEIMAGKLPSKAFLRDHYGNIWPVEIGNIDNKTYFLEGWTRFIKQNHMEHGDFFIFQYDGIHVFNVKLFGTDSCGKRGVGSLVHKLKKEAEADQENDLEVHQSYISEEDDKNEPKKDREENYGMETVDVKQMNSSQSSDTNNGSENVTVGNEGAEESHQSKRKKSVDPHGYKIFKSGIVPRPQNPYFIAEIKKKRQDELFVPTETIKAYKLKLPAETFLRDPRGRAWNSTLVVWKDGRSCRRPESMAYIGGEVGVISAVESPEIVVSFADGDMRVPRDFGGERDVVEWLQYFDSFGSRFPIPELERFGCVQQSLIGVAQDWYQILMAGNEQLSWSGFSEKFIRRFGGEGSKEHKFALETDVSSTTIMYSSLEKGNTLILQDSDEAFISDVVKTGDDCVILDMTKNGACHEFFTVDDNFLIDEFIFTGYDINNAPLDSLVHDSEKLTGASATLISATVNSGDEEDDYVFYNLNDEILTPIDKYLDVAFESLKGLRVVVLTVWILMKMLYAAVHDPLLKKKSENFMMLTDEISTPFDEYLDVNSQYSKGVNKDDRLPENFDGSYMMWNDEFDESECLNEDHYSVIIGIGNEHSLINKRSHMTLFANEPSKMGNHVIVDKDSELVSVKCEDNHGGNGFINRGNLLSSFLVDPGGLRDYIVVGDLLGVDLELCVKFVYSYTHLNEANELRRIVDEFIGELLFVKLFAIEPGGNHFANNLVNDLIERNDGFGVISLEFLGDEIVHIAAVCETWMKESVKDYNGTENKWFFGDYCVIRFPAFGILG
ncbi:OLC1v1035808C1 [Oldenlandia corymbosa var. corymbosa]|uniref:OLC1v1035808C1 n=1 Tax=Oldenlandia corymbosa var. corymbosa TaxID=529605 RepID=A0AAV1CX16_OLDCO|nr:OLC1v1035808C1 [Oldenlandia corymbosa var. corymbosa]